MKKNKKEKLFNKVDIDKELNKPINKDKLILNKKDRLIEFKNLNKKYIKSIKK